MIRREGSFSPSHLFFLMRPVADEISNLNSLTLHKPEDSLLSFAGVPGDTLNLNGGTAGIFEICYFITARNYFIGNIILHF